MVSSFGGLEFIEGFCSSISSSLSTFKAFQNVSREFVAFGPSMESAFAFLFVSYNLTFIENEPIFLRSGDIGILRVVQFAYFTKQLVENRGRQLERKGFDFLAANRSLWADTLSDISREQEDRDEGRTTLKMFPVMPGLYPYITR